MGEQAAAGSEKTDEESDEIEQAQESGFRWKRAVKEENRGSGASPASREVLLG